MSEKYSGSEWLESAYKHMPEKTMSPFGKEVADILGQAFKGIYHISRDALRADFSEDGYVSLTISAFRDWSTYDGELLTVLVVLCHEACIRMQIEPAGPRYLRLRFHKRQRTGGLMERMPTIEDHVKSIKENYLLEEMKR